MSVASYRNWLRLGLLLCAVLAVYALVRGDLRQRLRSDVFSLLADSPAQEGGMSLVRQIMERQVRILVVHLDGPDHAQAAETVRARLDGLASIQSVEALGIEALADVGAVLFDERMTLLFPRRLAQWRKAYEAAGAPAPDFETWLAGRAARNMEDALAEPELLALAELLPRDPLLLLPDALRTLSRQDGGRGNSSLVMAMLAVPPTDNTAQREVLGTLELLRTELRTAGVELAYTGAVRFSAENERVIRRDVLRINLLIGAVMLGLLLLVLRSLRALLLVALPVCLSALVAVALLLSIQGELHVLALGIAGILGGVALDYPLHILMHHRQGEDSYAPAVRRILRPLLLGCLSTVIVFGFLAFSSLPFIRQTGLLIGVGLLAAGILAPFCLTAFPAVANVENTARRLLVRGRIRSRGVRFAVLALMLAFCLNAGRLRWEDSPEILSVRLPALQAEDRLVRSTAGDVDNVPFLTSGAGLADVVQRAHALEAPGAALNNILAGADEAAAAATWLTAEGAGFQQLFSDALEARGFDSGAFAPIFAGVNPSTLCERQETALREFAAALPPSLAWLMGEGSDGAWLVTMLPPGAAMAAASQGLGVELSIREHLRQVFGGYRRSMSDLALGGFLVASLLVLAVNGLRGGRNAILGPALAVCFSMGVQGLLGLPASLFTVAGLLLGFGLAMDYVLFTEKGGNDNRASVRFSAVTTLGAFAVLSTSGIPAIAALGLSVLLVVAATLTLCELHPATHD